MTVFRASSLVRLATLALALPACAQVGHPPDFPPPRPLPSNLSPTSIPPTAPTAMPAPIAATAPPVSNGAPHRAEVTFAAGLLNVRADNSSLNQILRQVARLTGMKVTGGVADERVYGNYGPAEPSTILATLLGGTGSNMLLRDSPNGVPAELVLTPRGGGPTPPSPEAPIFDAHDEPENRPLPPSGPPGQAQPPISTQQQVSGPPMVQPLNNVNGSSTNTSPTASTLPTTNSVPTDSLPTPSTTPSSSGIVDAPNPPPSGTTTSTPDGGATPESIYQQLKALQAARQQQSQQQSQPQSQPPANPPQ